MKRYFVFAMILWILCFGGCDSQKASPPSHLVTGIDISCQKQDVQIRRHYTDQQKMAYVLLYLRLAQSGQRIAHPSEAATGEIYRITLDRSDGSIAEYRQKDHRYLSKNHGPWQQIDPAYAEGLYRLLRFLPSDGL